jgi:hypothetical protein
MKEQKMSKIHNMVRTIGKPGTEEFDLPKGWEIAQVVNLGPTTDEERKIVGAGYKILYVLVPEKETRGRDALRRMSDIQLLLLMLVGKTCIYTIQRFPLVEKIKSKFLFDLFHCGLCLGVWVYFIFAALFKVALFKEVFYFPVVSELATGAMVSLAVHLFSIGFQDFFGTITIGEVK